MVPYVDVAVVVTVMRVLPSVLHVCLLRECDGTRVMVVHVVQILWMSVVRGMRGVGGVCEAAWV